jgi:hypothetical protein
MQYSTYEEVPWFRRSFVVFLLLLILWPASLIIILTGDVYYVQKGELKTRGKAAKAIMLTLIAIIAVISALSVLGGN